jgi:7-carboxy-7-deazaguanine synthase
MDTLSAAGSLVVAECFGPTIQGEGPSAGRRASFLRLGGCNLHCTWCDSAYTWDAARHDLRAELTRRDVADLAAELLAHHTDLVVLTGGEPLLHQRMRGWGWLLARLHGAGRRLEVETNGTLLPDRATIPYLHQLNVSPKLAHAGDPETARIRPRVLAALARLPHSVFKFVARERADLDEIATIVADAGIASGRVWVMPEGTTIGEVLGRGRLLADPVLQRGWNLTLRSHVLLWPEQPRGR